MKKQIASLVVGLASISLAALPGMAASTPRSVAPEHQFHIQPKKGRSEQFDRIQAKMAEQQAAREARLSKRGVVPQNAKTPLASKNLKPRRYTGGPTNTVGFVSATEIPTGGYVASNPALTGDFNGDGKKDLLTVVTATSTGSISISVSLGNGDGTFQSPQITAIPANESDAFVVGDLNGDGKDDVIVVHLAGNISASSPSSFDVFLSNGDGTFTAGQNFAITSNSLAGGILYDINGDGKLDAVTVDSAGQGGGTGNVWVLLGNGDGTFQAPIQTALSGTAGSNVVFGDFNGDGYLDFADNDFSTYQLTVYLGMAPAGGSSFAPQFAAAVSYQTPDGVYDATGNAVGDMTGDGKPEIVSFNCNDNNITVYKNDGSGNFGTGAYFPASVAPATDSTAYVCPYSGSIADVNGDGFGDVTSVNDYSGDISVLFSNGDGTVQTPGIGYATGGYPYTSPIVSDFNGDGLPDIVVTNETDSLIYMKGFGDGTFQSAVDYYTPTTDNGEPYAWDIASGDFNGDGIPDVVLGNWCCDSTVGISVFLSNGDGTLKPGVNYGSGGFLAYVAVADFNKDGNLDIAAVDNSTGTIQIFNGVGDGTFTTGITLTTGDTDSERIVAADLNGDGYPDLVVANYNGSNVGVFLNNGAGNFAAEVPYTLFNPAWEVEVADVNGDGKPDLLLSQSSAGNLAVLLGNGDGTFGAENDYALGNNPQIITVGDFNNDGKLDVAAAMQDYTNGMGVAVALGNGDGTFQPANVPPYPSSLQAIPYNSQITYIRSLDLNGDGNLDVIYTNSNYGTVGVMFGNGDGTFGSPVEFATGEWAAGLTLADVNNDGAVDVVTASDDASEASVLLNSSGSALVPNYSVAVNTNTATVNPGQSGTFTLTLTPHNFYNGTVTFACAGLPSEATCSFSSPTLTPNGNTAMTSTLTITTTAPSSSSGSMWSPMNGTPWSGNSSLLAIFSSFALMSLMLAASQKKNRRLAVVLGAIVIGTMMITVGCGGGNGGSGSGTQIKSDPGTPTGNYQVTVTATGTAGTNGGNTSAHNVTLTLTVQ